MGNLQSLLNLKAQPVLEWIGLLYAIGSRGRWLSQSRWWSSKTETAEPQASGRNAPFKCGYKRFVLVLVTVHMSENTALIRM